MGAFTTSPFLKTYTIEEFWELPEPTDHSKLELIAGVLYMTPPPEQAHDHIVARLNRYLTNYIVQHNLQGELLLPRAAIWTSPATYLEPDLFYVSAELQERMDPDKRTCADLVIEVMSPSNEVYDRTTKSDTYLALGVREIWLVSQTRKLIEVRTEIESATYSKSDPIQSSVFPDLHISVDQLFL